MYVRDLSMHTVHSVGECERIMEQGWRNRSVGYTLMNKDSSRSHSIFTIHLEICTTGQLLYTPPCVGSLSPSTTASYTPPLPDLITILHI